MNQCWENTGKQDEIIYCIKEAGRDGLGYLCIEALSTSYSFMGGGAIVPIVADRYQPCLSRWVRGMSDC